MVRDTKLYTILGVEPESSQAEITKAFRIRARLIHPDKNRNDPAANEKFQILQSAYELLKDPKKRQRYDETGCAESDTVEFEEAYERFRSMFTEVTADEIDSFAASYKNSEEEKEDIINFYERLSGDLTNFFDFVPLSEPAECDRFLSIIHQLIADSRLRDSASFRKTAPKFSSIAANWQRRHRQEAKKADKKKNKLTASSNGKKRQSGDDKTDESANVDDIDALRIAILGNQNKRQSKMQSALEGVIRRVESEEASASTQSCHLPSEKQFQEAKDRLLSRSNAKRQNEAEKETNSKNIVSGRRRKKSAS